MRYRNKCLPFHSHEKAEMKMETFSYRKSRIWEMKEDEYTKSLTKNQVYAIVHMRDIWKNVLLYKLQCFTRISTTEKCGI